MQDYPGGVNPKKGAPTYYLTKFSQKLHENGENWAECVFGGRGERGMRPKCVYVDLPLIAITFKVNFMKDGRLDKDI